MVMSRLLREAIHQKKQFLISKLLLSGFYQEDDKWLRDYTLSELEKEYESLKTLKKEPLQ